MPSRNTIRHFNIGSSHHIFNRGVEKRIIFIDEHDYAVFTYYLFVYLAPIELVLKKYPSLALNLRNKNLNSKLHLLSYCLMPNHFHLMVHLSSVEGISSFLQQLTNAYTTYFNTKYSRVGSLMQGRYKAVEVTNQAQLMHLSRYIHLNPVAAGLSDKPGQYQWSSMNDYISGNFRPFVSPKLLQDNNLTNKNYTDFVQQYIVRPNPVEIMAANELIERIAIED